MRHLLALSFLVLPAMAFAQTRALIVTGLGAEPKYQQQFMALGERLSTALVTKYGIPEANVTWLGEDSTSKVKSYKGRSTSVAILRELDLIATSAKPNEQVIVVLIGHGSGQGEDSKFNIPGPDIAARDFNLEPKRFGAQRLAFLNLTTASGDALPILSFPNRIVVTSTKSAYERNESQFARFFVEALDKSGAADVDKDGRVSLLEAYRYAATETRRSYEADERLMTEHAQLDDDGNGKGSDLPDGRSAGDGLLARRFFLDGGAGGARQGSSDPRMNKLYTDKFEIEDRIDALKQRKASMKEDAYYAQLEPLLVSLARVARDIRQGEGR
ncbi:MAG: hypothetical protein ABIR92_11580 [Gemmatimonadaceae bacterium]